MQFDPAPPLQVSRWLNTPEPVSLAALRGQVVLLHAFQMLCPGCVTHGIPQAQRVRRLFSTDELAVIGLHTVFEHHEVMTPAALRVFLHEYRLGFPVGIDQAGEDSPIPLRLQHFGQIDVLQLGAAIGQLRAQPRSG